MRPFKGELLGSCVRAAERGLSRARMANDEPDQVVDFIPDVVGREALGEFQVDEANEQRIKRTSSGQQLLGDISERSARRHHPRECGNLSPRTLCMPYRARPFRAGNGWDHGRTRTAPVMPAAG